jgi:hypothetical protein
VVSTSDFAERSSARSSVSSAIWPLRVLSTVSWPVTSRASRNWAIMNTDKRKVMTSKSWAMASTKPGQ